MDEKRKMDAMSMILAATMMLGSLAGVGGSAGAMAAPSATLYLHRALTGVGEADGGFFNPMNSTPPNALVPAVYETFPIAVSRPPSDLDAVWLSDSEFALDDARLKVVWWVASPNQGVVSSASTWLVQIWQERNFAEFLVGAEVTFTNQFGQVPVELNYTLPHVSTIGSGKIWLVLDAKELDQAGTQILYDSVTPGGSGCCPSRIEIRAQNQAPTADIEAPTCRNVNANVEFDGSGSSDADGTIVSYVWDFGDGGSATGAIVEHQFSTTGNHTVTLTVTDDEGATDSATHDITSFTPPPGGCS